MTISKRDLIKAAIATAVAASIAGVSASAQDAVTSGYADINGLKYYYEISGSGDPMLVLHGGLGNIGTFGMVLPGLAEHRQLIAVDLHGHGRTQLGDRDISYVDQGADMAALVKSLGHDQVDVMGYSFGGGVAFQFAVQNPSMVRRLVIVSAPFGQDGFFAEMLPQQAAVGAALLPMMKETPMYQTYIAVAPDPEEFPGLLDQMGALMRQPYDWSADVAKLTMPVMLVYGDSDMIRPEHIIEFYQMLGGGLKDAGWMRENMSQNRLAILPGVTHYELSQTPQLLPAILPFLDGKMGP
jgi:pimeloyl-ACP methyl ester carboxylesterase